MLAFLVRSFAKGARGTADLNLVLWAVGRGGLFARGWWDDEGRLDRGCDGCLAKRGKVE